MHAHTPEQLMLSFEPGLPELAACLARLITGPMRLTVPQLLAVSRHTAGQVGRTMRIDEALDAAIAIGATSEHSRATVDRYQSLWIAFGRFCGALDVERVDQLSPAIATRWINALTRTRNLPSISTRRLRRTALRQLVEVWVALGFGTADPTAGLWLPPRQEVPSRPFTEREIDRIRSASLATTVETRLPAIVALAEAGAGSAEIPQVRPADLALPKRVWLRGHTKTDPRYALLSPWGATQLSRRLRQLSPDDRSLTYEGGGTIESAQASTSAALRQVLNLAGLGRSTGIAIRSFRSTYGRAALDATGRIEDAAAALGMQSLDQATLALGYEWRTQP